MAPLTATIGAAARLGGDAGQRVSNELRELARTRFGGDARKVGKLIGIDSSLVKRIVQGRAKPGIVTAAAIARATGKPLAELVGDEVAQGYLARSAKRREAKARAEGRGGPTPSPVRHVDVGVNGLRVQTLVDANHEAPITPADLSPAAVKALRQQLLTLERENEALKRFIIDELVLKN